MIHTQSIQSDKIPNIVFFSYMIIFICLTVSFGGNFLLAKQVLVVLLGGLAIASFFSTNQQGLPWGARVWPVWAMVICSAIALVIPLLAAVPVNGGLAKGLGLEAHPFFSTLAVLAITPEWIFMGLNPAMAFSKITLAWGYGAAALVLVFLSKNENMSIKLLKSFALLVLAFAIYGMAERALGWNMVSWEEKRFYLNDLTSTFINRNHSATFLGLGMLACLALGVQRIGEISSKMPFMQRMKAFYHLCLVPGWGWLAGATLLLVAVVLTHSRAGLGVAGLGIIVMLGSLAVARPAVRSIIGLAFMSACMVFIVVLAAVGGGVGSRLEKAPEDAEVRQNINLLSWKSWENAPWLGQGYGSWQPSAANVRTDELSVWLGTLDSAHNTYLEILVETGVFGLMALGGVAFILLAVLLNGLVVRRRHVMWPALGLGALVLVAAHASVDFSLSIPAVVLAFLTLLVPACMHALPPAAPDTPTPAAPWAVKAVMALVFVPVVALAGWQAWAAWPSRQAQPAMLVLRAGLMPPVPAIAKARHNLEECLRRNPYHPTCADDLSLLYLMRANQIGLTEAGGKLLLGRAEHYAMQSLAHGPANAVVAYRLSRIRAIRNGEAAGIPALMHSVLAGPVEPKLAMARLVPLLRNYPSLGADDKILVAGNIRLLWRLERRLFWRTVKARSAEFLPILAAILAEGPGGATPELLAQWQKITKQPWPLAAPLGSSPVSP